MPLRTDSRTRVELLARRAAIPSDAIAQHDAIGASRAPRGSRQSPAARRRTAAAPAPDARSAMPSARPWRSRRPMRAISTASGNDACRRSASAAAANAAAASAATQAIGSCSAVKYSAMPAPNATGSQGSSRPGPASAAAQPRSAIEPGRRQRRAARRGRARAASPVGQVRDLCPAAAAPPRRTPLNEPSARQDAANATLPQPMRADVNPSPTSLAKVSRSPMVRLNTGRSGVESRSRTK